VVAHAVIRAYRVDVRHRGTIRGHGEIGAQFDVVVASPDADGADPEEFAAALDSAVLTSVQTLVWQVERPAVVGFTVGGWVYQTFLAAEVADEDVRELRLSQPRQVIAQDNRGTVNRVVYSGVPRRTAEALGDYLMDRISENDVRLRGAGPQHVREREAALRRVAGSIRGAAGWQIAGEEEL
jgi:hypothetical protein